MRMKEFFGKRFQSVSRENNVSWYRNKLYVLHLVSGIAFLNFKYTVYIGSFVSRDAYIWIFF